MIVHIDPFCAMKLVLDLCSVRVSTIALTQNRYSKTKVKNKFENVQKNADCLIVGEPADVTVEQSSTFCSIILGNG